MTTCFIYQAPKKVLEKGEIGILLLLYSVRSESQVKSLNYKLEGGAYTGRVAKLIDCSANGGWGLGCPDGSKKEKRSAFAES